MFFYTYMHLDPRTFRVRYVGVGSKARAFDLQTRSAAHLHWIAELEALGLEPEVALPTRTLDREEAMYVERALIAWHREQGSVLFNVAAGGRGGSGIKMTDMQKQHLSSVHQAKWLFDAEFRARRLPDMARARAERNRTPEHRAKIRKHENVVGGKACKKCSGRLRYKTSRNCVNCARKP